MCVPRLVAFIHDTLAQDVPPRKLGRGIVRLADVLELDPKLAKLEYLETVSVIIAKTKKAQPWAGLPNRRIWARFLRRDWQRKYLEAKRVAAALIVLPEIIRFYLAIEDGDRASPEIFYEKYFSPLARPRVIYLRAVGWRCGWCVGVCGSL